MFILGVFSWLASTAKNLVTAGMENSGLPNASGIGTIVFGVVLAFGIAAAADQLGIAQTLINTLFIGVVAALALAFGLAFGLGGRDQAAEIWADWRGHAEGAIDKASANDEDTEARRTREKVSRAS